jgi:biopolymer transport protein ExbB
MRRLLGRRLPLLLSILCLAVIALPIAAAEAAGAGEAAPAAEKIGLFQMIRAGGPIMAILVVLSIVSYGLAVNWTLTIKRDTLLPDGLADDVHNCFAEGVSDEAVDSARGILENDNSMLGNVIAAALDKRDFGYDAMKEAAESVGIAEHNRYVGKVGWLSLFASSATLLGLLGTVIGIIGSFITMANNPGGVDANKLAENIGEALVCTAAGLIVAIGALVFFYLLRSRVNQAAIDAGVIANEILDYFRPQSA